MDLGVPDVQRNLDVSRMQSIVEFQKAYHKAHGTLLFMGDLTVFDVGGGRHLLIDGLHRYEAMKLVYLLQPDYQVSLNIVYPTHGLTLEKAFLLINMARPVPDYVINTTMQHTKRVQLENLRSALIKEYRMFISASPNPRSPNFSVERIVSEICTSGLSDIIASVDSLLEYVKFANVKLAASADPKLRNLAQKKMAKYNLVSAAYFSADPFNDWMTNKHWFQEFLSVGSSSSSSSLPVHDGDIHPQQEKERYNTTNQQQHRPAVQRKKRVIPRSVRDVLWKSHFGTSPNGICKCCAMNPLEYTTFHAGHVVSQKNGGSDELSNLLPLCSPCNLGMGAMNIVSFQKKYGFAPTTSNSETYNETEAMAVDD
jgi:5-methylcytosine-specific restriction endonuclease McrA